MEAGDMNPNCSTLAEILDKSFTRYIRVRPSGLELRQGKIVQSISAEILAVRSARTLYENRKPVCRSLDGIQSLREGRSCASCLMRKRCTPQMLVEILHDGMPLRLLLAYTGARNFLRFVGSFRERKEPLEGARIFISVRDRGRWGEVRFHHAPPREERQA